MSNGKTIGELIEEMRLKAGAKEYTDMSIWHWSALLTIPAI